MKIVKLTFNYNWPIFRQTPDYQGVWKDYKFVIDDDLKECDYWVIFGDYDLQSTHIICNPKNIIFIPGEGYYTSPKYSKDFLNQFGLVVTSQKEIKTKNVYRSHNANHWFINKSYDYLVQNKVPEKIKKISVISSDKTTTLGHRKRLEFVKEIYKNINDITFYGRGINNFEDKWDTLAPYKYSITIENDFADDYVTEKYFDCLYSNTLSFYYGCPNLEKFVNSKTFIRIDINDIESSISIIKEAIKNNEYEKRKDLIQEEKIKSLNRDQFFPFIVSILDKQVSCPSKKRKVFLNSNVFFKKTYLEKIYSKVKFFLELNLDH
jgi:hypothetical protein